MTPVALSVVFLVVYAISMVALLYSKPVEDTSERLTARVGDAVRAQLANQTASLDGLLSAVQRALAGVDERQHAIASAVARLSADVADVRRVVDDERQARRAADGLLASLDQRENLHFSLQAAALADLKARPLDTPPPPPSPPPPPKRGVYSPAAGVQPPCIAPADARSAFVSRRARRAARRTSQRSFIALSRRPTTKRSETCWWLYAASARRRRRRRRRRRQ